MSMMQATAIITAVDRASGVFARVAAAARAASGRYQAAAAGFAGANHRMHGALTMAAPTALGIGMFGFDQYQWDRAIHRYNAIGEIAPEAMAKVENAIIGISNRLRISKMELLDAAKAWQQLGNSPESFIKNVEWAGRASRITEIEVGEQMNESSAILRAFGKSVNDEAAYKHFEEVYTVASKGMYGGAQAFGEAFKQWAPVAASMGLTMEQGAAFAQTLGGQFDPETIGTALRTSFMRLAAPTRDAKSMLLTEGIDPSDYARFDEAKLRDSGRFAKMISGMAVPITPAIEKLIKNDIANADFSQGIDAVIQKLEMDLHLAIGKMSQQDSSILKEAIINYFGSAMTGLDPKKFFETFGPQANNLAFNAVVWGKQRAAVMMDLLKQSEHYGENLDNIIAKSPGALERKWEIYAQGFSWGWDRVRVAVDNFLNSVGSSGIKKDLSGLFESMGGFFETLQKTDPNILRTAFWGLAGLAALAPAGFLLSGIATSFGMIGSAAALLEAALYGGGIATGLAQIGSVARLGGLAAVGFALYEIYEHWEQLKAIAQDPLKLDIVWPEAPWWLRYAVEGLDKIAGYNRAKKWEGDVARYEGDILGEIKARGRIWGDPVVANRVGLHGETPDMPLSPLTRELDAWRASLTGTVTGKMTLDARIQVDGPGKVIDQKTGGGDLKGTLNTGKSMPDAGNSGGSG